VIDRAEIQSFADGFFPRQMKKHRIPGLAFVFVQGGNVAYAQAYGEANLEAATPMDAASTGVRIGSVSKPFVATAVMQLVEQGALDLHTDVNEYLSTFQLDETFPEPVTLAHLLTHTAGFEDPPYVSNTDPGLVEPLAGHLATNMPPRIYPPGEFHIYSNYGYALAGLVVEEVAGQPFDRYVADHILGPLGMDDSRYLVSPPAPDAIAIGYQVQQREQVAQPLDWDSAYPGGSIVSTADDMARFMLAQLGDGCHDGACILQPESLAQMHTAQAQTGSEGQRVTYGFSESVAEDVRLVGHSGAIRGFGSSLVLLPDHDMGYFLSFNEECYQTTACEVVGKFREAFLKRFFG
jgi:CubicO group peptidase (beta-lactamase class C family)